MEKSILYHPRCSYRTDGYFPSRFRRSCYQLKIALLGTYLPVLLLRLAIKHLFFGYKPYLFEKKGHYSLSAKVWFIFHQLFNKLSPQLYSCEGLLPSLPLPSLNDTIAKYLNSVEPLLSPHEFMDVKKMAQNFLKNEGWKLQGLAWLYWCFADNYDVFNGIPANQAVRSAHVVFLETMSMLSVDRQSLKPIANGCISLSNLWKCYGTTRVPGEIIDHLEMYCGTTSHIAIYHRGCIYKLEVFDENRHILSLEELTEIFSELLNRNESVGEVESRIAALTTDSRHQWCLNRRRFFLENTLNRDSLAAIESAIFYLVLDDACYSSDSDHPEMLENFLKNMLTGDGCNRWADKSLNYVIAANGRMKAEIIRCYDNYQEQINDVDVACIVSRNFGKGLIKKAGISPDAFIQMAIQLASFKDQNKFCLTYESASARFYAKSRTETLRPVTKESCAFVKSMISKDCNSEECLELLKEAVQVHTNHGKECLIGKGIDRHLFVLHILSKMTGIKSPLLEYYIAQPWELSTSQTPNMTRQMDEDEHPDCSWFGAGFQAVCKNGYGISYRFAGNHSLCINIASYKSAKNTDSQRLKQHLLRSMHDMFALLES
uniref:Choline/carnitine acyltransferase domain-containing protein n=1 Tax=Setaria digitata TaxID=48799 RepID=A0A915PN97_9BILA